MDCAHLSLDPKWCEPSVLASLIQAVATVVTAGLASWIAVLYTRETKKMRQSTDFAARIAERAFYTSISPYLVISLARVPDQDLATDSTSDEASSINHVLDRYSMLDHLILPPSAPRREYVFKLRIIGDRMPNHICCAWFDKTNARYYFSPIWLEALTQRDVISLPIINEPFEPEEASALLAHTFEERWHERLQYLIIQSLPHQPFHSLVAFYFDHVGTLYATPRGMIMEKQDDIMFFLKSDLVTPPGSEELSPSFTSTFDPAIAKSRYGNLRKRKRH